MYLSINFIVIFHLFSVLIIPKHTLSVSTSTSTSTTAASNSEGSPDAMNERKINFLHYLSSSGIYHDFKEKLKPKLQRAARCEY